MKRVVRLKNKHTGEINTYPTIADLMRRNGDKTLGIGLNSLYNAVSSGKGRWENNSYEVYYEDIELGNKEWD